MDTETHHIESHMIGEPYPSRKNMVFKTIIDGKTYVAKIYSEEREHLAEKEHSLLRECVRRGLRVPIPAGLRGRVLLLEPVDGVNAVERLDSIWEAHLEGDGDAERALTTLVDGVASWLAEFHRAFEFKAVRGDAILRNFVIGTDGIVTGLDLEESVSGDPLDDIGQLCAFVVSMRPGFTEARFELAGRFADRYWEISGVNRARSELGNVIARALRKYAEYRKDGGEIVEWAARIERGEVVL